MRSSTFPARARTLIATAAAMVTLSAAMTANAQFVLGPEWVEDGDAGSLPGSAQVVTGQGQVQKITGMLAGAGNLAGAGDFEDMYRINIVSPTMFSIRTDPGSGGMANFDTQLWVFDLSGFGILGNDNAPVFEGEGFGDSAIFQFATDNTESGIFEPGEYLICISGAGNRPTSTIIGQAGTAPQIFFFDPQNPFEISGPDGPGGGFPVSGWAPAGATGSYSIALTGVDFIVPAPGALALLALGAVAPRQRRRRS
jgi:uncharacterized protein (TIGR03382 family)